MSSLAERITVHGSAFLPLTTIMSVPFDCAHSRCNWKGSLAKLMIRTVLASLRV
jgi:hypothetical protein